MTESYPAHENVAIGSSDHGTAVVAEEAHQRPERRDYGVGIQVKGRTVAVVATGLTLDEAEAERRRLKGMSRAKKTKPVVLAPGFEIQPVERPRRTFLVVDGGTVMMNTADVGAARAAQWGIASPTAVVYSARLRFPALTEEEALAEEERQWSADQHESAHAAD